jgi:hypothetical protein
MATIPTFAFTNATPEKPTKASPTFVIPELNNHIISTPQNNNDVSPSRLKEPNTKRALNRVNKFTIKNNSGSNGSGSNGSGSSGIGSSGNSDNIGSSGSSGSRVSKRSQRRANASFRKTKRHSNIKISASCELEEIASNLKIVEQKVIDSRTKPTIYFVKDTKPPYKWYLIKRIDLFGATDEKEVKKQKSFDIESAIYKCVSHLVYKKITPHVITGGDQKICDGKVIKYGFIINETFNQDHYHVFSLEEFMDTYIKNPMITNDPIITKIMIHIMFQLVYTLKCFARINLKHNDLHTGNILLFISKTHNIFQHWAPKKYNTYVYNENEDKVDLFDIGIKVCILDFDGANKNKADTAINELNVEVHQFNDSPYGKIFLSRENNPYSDLFKLVAYIYKSFSRNDFIKAICAKLIRMTLDVDANYNLEPDTDADDKNLYKKGDSDEFRFHLNEVMKDRAKKLFTTGLFKKLNTFDEIPEDIEDIQSAVNEKYREYVTEYLKDIRVKKPQGYDSYIQIVQKKVKDVYDFSLSPGGKTQSKKPTDTTIYSQLSKDDDTYVPKRVEMMDPTEYLEYIVKVLRSKTEFCNTTQVNKKGFSKNFAKLPDEYDFNNMISY